MLHSQIPWFIAGPVMGLCVVACRLLFNGRLGVTGGFSELIGKLGRGSVRFDWRGWFAIGLFVGGALFLLVSGGLDFHGYGWMTRTFHGDERIWMPVLLLVGGGLIGFGAKLSGGCTSGNGLSGIAAFSPASIVATGTFFGTAIIVSLVIKALI
jgi:uncharacterized membrane protein YedE/YeeE